MRAGREHQPGVLAPLAKALDGQRGAQRIQPEPSVTCGDAQSQQPEFSSAAPLLMTEPVLSLAGREALVELAPGELQRALSQGQLVARQVEVHESKYGPRTMIVRYRSRDPEVDRDARERRTGTGTFPVGSNVRKVMPLMR
jgi:hypothetical protein